MCDRVQKIIDEAIAFFMGCKAPDQEGRQRHRGQEEEIDDLVLTLRTHHVARLNNLECSRRWV